MYSLRKILQSEIDHSEFSNKCVYYHFYIDSLLNAIVHIRRRFDDTRYNIKKNEKLYRHINRNKEMYRYINEGKKEEWNYPTIHNSSTIRNFVEHINEKNAKLIEADTYYGCFNVVYEGMDLNTKEELRSNEKKQNNLLYLINKEYRILTVKDEKKKVEEYKLDLLELEKELKEMKAINDQIWEKLNTK